VAILIISTIVLMIFNSQHTEERKRRQDDAFFLVRANGATYTVDRTLLAEIGESPFAANKKSDGKPAAAVAYHGVPLMKLCEKLKIDLSNVTGCIASAADGYHATVSIKQILDGENVFIASGQDGRDLAKKDDGGDGPFMLVVVKDPFSQNWCKYLSELEFVMKQGDLK